LGLSGKKIALEKTSHHCLREVFMSAEHPIVAITGSSSVVSDALITALEHVFWVEQVKAAYIEGTAFFRYERDVMREKMQQAQTEKRLFSHYHPAANQLDQLQALFAQYAATGQGQYRHYIRNARQARKAQQAAGTFTAWQAMDADTDLLLYHGLHGGVVTQGIDILQYPDLLLGIAPNANMEWTRKVQQDIAKHAATEQQVQAMILHHLPDYIAYIMPQFEHVHINFQMIPVVDTCDPFHDTAVPNLQECYLVIRFQRDFRPWFPQFMQGIPGAFMARQNTLVVPGTRLLNVAEVILMPLMHNLISTSRQLRQIEDVPPERERGLLHRLR
jgi:phosphoribulokinase